jgi:hypothetical protein
MDSVTAGGLATALGSMAATTKTIIETVKAARTKVKSPEIEKTLSEALEQIFSLQTGMLDLQAKILHLQEENSQLREKIRREEERAKDRGQYQRKKVGKAEVLVREGDSETFYCPTCFQVKGHYIPLTKIDDNEYSHMCFTCHTPFPLGRRH